MCEGSALGLGSNASRDIARRAISMPDHMASPSRWMFMPEAVVAFHYAFVSSLRVISHPSEILAVH